MHDLLLAKKGIAAPATHPLRLAVSKHKARLNAELTKARLKRGLTSIEDLRTHVEIGSTDGPGKPANENPTEETSTLANFRGKRSQPRWVRINTLLSNLDEQLKTTFSDYRAVDSVKALVWSTTVASSAEKLIHIDKHIPNLVALSPGTNVLDTRAYQNGLIVLQDKASCFPAYLLDPRPEDGPCLDACAAPGNKTTHIVAILQSLCKDASKPKVWACERDRTRAVTLQKMVDTAGARNLVEVKVAQDFLRLDPHKAPWDKVSSLLLDPSCSGSGMTRREESHIVVLPSEELDISVKAKSKKRKRKSAMEPDPGLADHKEELPIVVDSADMLRNRLEALSTFQLKLILHAFQFPKAQKITYSTCSVYAQEDEHVVIKALTSQMAKQEGWHILRRADQVPGTKTWNIRGDITACQELLTKHEIKNLDAAEVAEGCIRCEKGTEEGTQGFFVAAFVRGGRNPPRSGPSNEANTREPVDEDGQEWNGFDD